MIAAMADGETRIDNFARSSDCSSTLTCLAALGVEIRRDVDAVFVNGVGKCGFTAPTAPLDCGNSGTTMRLLAGILAGQNFESVLTGDESLQKRPMKRVIEPLELMGAVIQSNDGIAPLSISGKQPLRSIEYSPPVASAQVKSCVLLAGLNSSGVTSVIETVPIRDHTERMLRWFGVDVEIDKIEKGTRNSVSGEANLTARDLIVPSDISAAAFFMVAAACLKASDITFSNVGFNPSRRAIVDVLRNLGANIELLQTKDVCNEPVASLRVRGGLAHAGETVSPVLHGEIVANLIDEIPILAVFGTQLRDGLKIRDAAELRVKESDRITAIVQNLKMMGAEVTEFPDGFKVERSDLKGATIHSFGDHRIAMAFAIAGLFADGETEIGGAECADISFPGFFETLQSVVG
jgi:3-phosphoshikimate 1-carboxyvinyltransferase